MSVEETADKLCKVSDALLGLSTAVREFPDEWSMRRLAETFRALMDRASPFKVGDRVVIIDEPECTGGWVGYKHCLGNGQPGTIKERDFDPDVGAFVFAFEPDDSDLWWSSSDKLLRVGLQHFRFPLQEKRLAKTDKTRPERKVCGAATQKNGRPCEQVAGHEGEHA
jgi:hypothetical protein